MFKYIVCLFAFSLFSCSNTKNELKNTSNKPPLIFILNGGDNSVDQIDQNTLEIVKKTYIPNQGNVFAHHVNLSNSNKYLSIALPKIDFAAGHGGVNDESKEGGVAVIETISGKLVNNFVTPQVNHNAILVNNDKEIWTAGLSHKGLIYIYDASSEKLLETITVDAEPTELVLYNDMVYVVCESSSFMYVLNSKTRKIVKQIKVDPFPESIYLSTDGKIFVENKNKKSINIIDTEQQIVNDFIDLNFFPGAINFNSRTKELWVLSPEENKVYIFEKSNTWKVKTEIKTDRDPHDIKFFQNENMAIIVNQFSNNCHFIDANSKKIVKSMTVGSKPNGIAIWE